MTYLFEVRVNNSEDPDNLVRIAMPQAGVCIIADGYS